MQVEIVAHTPLDSVSGIGRYIRELYRHVSALVPVQVVTPINPPLADRVTTLHQFPLGLRGHQSGSIVHFTQIMGCAQMLWHPVRPAVVTVHDLGILVSGKDEQLYNRFDRWVLDLHIAGLKRMDYYAVSSDRTKLGLVDILSVPEERICHVPLGIDTTHFRPVPGAWPQIAERYSLRVVEGVADLLYVGSELPRKNLFHLLEAIVILKQQGQRVRLIKIGGPGGQQWRDLLLAQIERLQLHDDVAFMGVVPEEDLPLFLSIADLCVTPTLLEGGFAWLAKAAMACGKPIVATEEALIPADVRNAALIVNSRDPSEMAQAIATCLRDPELCLEMGRLGRNVIRKYNWETTAKAMVKVYELAARGGAQ